MTLTRAKLEQSATQYLQALEQKDPDGLASLFDVNGSREDPVGTETQHGRAAIRDAFAAALPETQLTMRAGSMRAAANTIAFPFTSTTAAPDGGAIVLEGIDVITYNTDGRITLLQSFWDQSDTRTVTPS